MPGTEQMYPLLLLPNRRDKGGAQGQYVPNFKKVMNQTSPPNYFIITHNLTFNSLSFYLIKTFMKRKECSAAVTGNDSSKGTIAQPLPGGESCRKLHQNKQILLADARRLSNIYRQTAGFSRQNLIALRFFLADIY